jgi:hypothetical protein
MIDKRPAAAVSGELSEGLKDKCPLRLLQLNAVHLANYRQRFAVLILWYAAFQRFGAAAHGLGIAILAACGAAYDTNELHRLSRWLGAADCCACGSHSPLLCSLNTEAQCTAESGGSSTSFFCVILLAAGRPRCGELHRLSRVQLIACVTGSVRALLCSANSRAWCYAVADGKQHRCLALVLLALGWLRYSEFS